MKIKKTRRISMWIDETIDEKIDEFKKAGDDSSESDLLRKVLHIGFNTFENDKQGSTALVNVISSYKK